HGGLAAWRRVHRLCFFPRLLPVVTESHLARCFAHFRVAPPELPGRKNDELLRRGRNQTVLQIPDQTLSSASFAGYATAVGLSRILRRQRFVHPCQFKFSALLQEEIVHLRVARELIEIESL